MASITSKVVHNLRGRGVTVLNHKQWGSKQRLLYASRRLKTKVGYWGKFIFKADTVVQHITVTNPSGDFARDVRTIEESGNARFGCGVSYNWLVDMETGEVAVGQPLDAKGVHTINDKNVKGYSTDQNLVARAIAVIGQPGTKLSLKAARSITQILAAMAEEGATTRNPDYLPHSFFAYKDCPCDSTRDRMSVIYENFQKEIR